MSKYKFLSVAMFILVLAGVAAAAWRLTHPPEDPQVVAVRDLQWQLFETSANSPQNGENTSATGRATSAHATANAASSSPSSPPKTNEQAEAERAELFTKLREQMENLTEEQRRQVMESGRDMFRAQMQARIKEYHALPEDQKVAYLDKEIDRWEERRAQFAQRRREREAQNQGAGGQNGSGGQNAGGDRPGRGRGDGPPRSDEDRQQWRRDMLGDTTPQERAEFAEYIDALNNRREQRGLETFEPWRR